MINEYFSGDPDVIKQYDTGKDGLWNSVKGAYNKYRGKTQYIHDWNTKGNIAFGYFQDTVDSNQVFKASPFEKFGKNGSHWSIIISCANSYIRNAKNRVGREGQNLIVQAINTSSACKGRVFADAKVISTWGMLPSNMLADIIKKLNLGDITGYRYVVGKKEYDLAKYINGNYNVSTGDANNLGKRIEDIDDKALQTYISMVRTYNTSSTKAKQLSAKLGNMTIAQYNSMLHQEGKKSEQVINEINNKDMNKYKEEFSNYIGIMKEALERENFEAYDAAKYMLEESIEECRHEKELAAQLDTNNFGVLNHIFEERLPGLFVANKKAVRDVIKVIKEDKNLSSQFDFYHNVKNYKGKIAEMVDPAQFLSNFNSVVEKHNLIDKDTVLESNKKLRKVLKENNILPTEFIDEENMSLYKAGHNILTKKQSLKNIATLTESINSVEGYMNKHKNDKINENIDPQKMINDFENKLRETLTESEMSFVKEITDWRSPIAEQRKEKLFNKFKNECIEKVDEMLKEDAGNVELESLKKQLEEQTFNKESIVQDIAKLLEIRDILLDK